MFVFPNHFCILPSLLLFLFHYFFFSSAGRRARAPRDSRQGRGGLAPLSAFSARGVEGASTVRGPLSVLCAVACRPVPRSDRPQTRDFSRRLSFAIAARAAGDIHPYNINRRAGVSRYLFTSAFRFDARRKPATKRFVRRSDASAATRYFFFGREFCARNRSRPTAAAAATGRRQVFAALG